MNDLPSTATAAGTVVLDRMAAVQSPAAVPVLSTEMLISQEEELNRELRAFLLDPPADPNLLRGRRVAILCTNGVEEVEILGAMNWLRGHGATVHIVAPEAGPMHPSYGVRMPPQAMTHVLAIRLMENAGWLPIDLHLERARPEDYDAVILPGGCWNPDFLRVNPKAQAFVRAMFEAGKPTCGICHGPWVMVSAGILRGRKATAVWNIHPDLANAGAEVLDQPCVEDGNLVTARFPYDLPRMMRVLARQLVRA